MTATTTVIVGTKYRGPTAVEAVGDLRVGDTLRLERETHRFDGWAIQCWVRSQCVGYLPKQVNGPIARAMDAGLAATAAVVKPARIARGHVVEEPMVLVQVAEPAEVPPAPGGRAND